MYQATVDESYNVSVNIKDDQVTVGDNALDLDLRKLSDTRYHVIYQHRSYRLEVIDANYDTKEFVISVNGKKTSVRLQSDLDQLLQTLGMDASAEAVVKEIRSPMPGLIQAVSVQEGDSVAAGDKLLTLEAMKMENAIKSPTTGTIAAINVKPGQSVEKNQVLISFE